MPRKGSDAVLSRGSRLTWSGAVPRCMPAGVERLGWMPLECRSEKPPRQPWEAVSMNDVTRILSAVEHGDARAAEQLLPLVYDELRRLAAAKMARERPDHTLDATALVHEAYLRLVGDGAYADHRHLFRLAAEPMRPSLLH